VPVQHAITVTVLGQYRTSTGPIHHAGTGPVHCANAGPLLPQHRASKTASIGPVSNVCIDMINRTQSQLLLEACIVHVLDF